MLSYFRVIWCIVAGMKVDVDMAAILEPKHVHLYLVTYSRILNLNLNFWLSDSVN